MASCGSQEWDCVPPKCHLVKRMHAPDLHSMCASCWDPYHTQYWEDFQEGRPGPSPVPGERAAMSQAPGGPHPQPYPTSTFLSLKR